MCASATGVRLFCSRRSVAASSERSAPSIADPATLATATMAALQGGLLLTHGRQADAERATG